MIMEHPDPELLTALADELLSGDRADALRTHIEHCAACAAVVARESALSAALRSQPLAEPSQLFDRRVLDAVLPHAAAEGKARISLRNYAGMFALCACTLVIFLAANGERGDAPSWLSPVYDTVGGATARITESFVSGIGRLVSPLRVATQGSNVFEIFLLATLALVLLGALDRIFSPLSRRER
jgi:anti-sigma factor RsiW